MRLAGKHLENTNTSAQSAGNLPPSLRMLRGRAERHFASRLKMVFDQVDDTFFDLADSARNHRRQTHYFDAMRLIRVERKTISSEFVRAISGAFEFLANPDVAAPKPAGRAEGSNFELIADDELEEIIALDTMVSKAEEQCCQQLQLFIRRLDNQVLQSVNSKNNPLGPGVICDSFFKATEGLEVGIRSKLVLLKLFERVRRERGFSSTLEPEMRGLEMAIMKVVLKDPSFFDKERHPARRLLNEVAQASMGFASEELPEQDPLYQKIHEVLEQLQGVATDDAVLTRLLTDFIAFVE